MFALQIPTAEVFDPLLQPARYKAAHGGRGSGKSRFFGSLMIEEHTANRGFRSVCVREVQKSLKESSKLMLEDRLKEYGLGNPQGFKVFNEVIQTPGDGLITFQGMNDQTAESIKSLEGFDRAWVEEAQTMSIRSLQLLRPTIRAPGSELWFSWNPRRKSDPVDVLFRGKQIPTNAVVVEANWRDNPWFPYELEQERLDSLRINPDQYQHTWEGDYITVSSGAYYVKELTQAKAEGRITRVPADPLMSYRAFWDIGGTGVRADACAIWIAQFVGKEIYLIDYYEAIGQPLSAHIAWLRKRGYGEALMVLPHDGANHEKIERATYQSALEDAGFSVEIVKNQGAGAALARIEAVRRLFPAMWFNVPSPLIELNEDSEVPNTQPGLDALGWYHEKFDEKRQIGLGPSHDWSSHCADAHGLMAVYYETQYKGTYAKHHNLDYSHINKMII